MVKARGNKGINVYIEIVADTEAVTRLTRLGQDQACAIPAGIREGFIESRSSLRSYWHLIVPEDRRVGFLQGYRPYPCSCRQARLTHIQAVLHGLWVFRGEKAHEVWREK